ncbi:hypothetical protein FB451DRAFT_1164834 [Mycena latifolia]|nr:hypothetical protein FB451DRAFT_1164834 [Mycena latifolia]
MSGTLSGPTSRRRRLPILMFYALVIRAVRNSTVLMLSPYAGNQAGFPIRLVHLGTSIHSRATRRIHTTNNHYAEPRLGAAHTSGLRLPERVYRRAGDLKNTQQTHLVVEMAKSVQTAGGAGGQLDIPVHTRTAIGTPHVAWEGGAGGSLDVCIGPGSKGNEIEGRIDPNGSEFFMLRVDADDAGREYPGCRNLECRMACFESGASQLDDDRLGDGWVDGGGEGDNDAPRSSPKLEAVRGDAHIGRGSVDSTSD